MRTRRHYGKEDREYRKAKTKRTYDTMTSMQVDTGGAKRGAKRRASGSTGRALTKRQRADVQNIIHRNQELKYVYFTAAATAVNSTPLFAAGQFDVAQGVTDQDRIGDSIDWCGTTELRIQVVNGQGATADTYNNVRLIVFQWHPNSVPVAANLLLNGPSGAPDIYSALNHDNRQQYLVLFDKTWKTVGPSNNTLVQGPNTNATTTGIMHYRISLKRATKHVQYVAGSLTATNRLWTMFVSDSALATHPSVAYTFKSFYRDG